MTTNERKPRRTRKPRHAQGSPQANAGGAPADAQEYTLADHAAAILRREGKPMTARAIAERLPEPLRRGAAAARVRVAMSEEVRKAGRISRFVGGETGVWSLRAWA